MNSTLREHPPALERTGVPARSPEDVASAVSHAITIPDNPVVVIEPRGSRLARDLRDVWAYRELLYFLTWRDVKVRYKQTALGVAWVVIQPLFTMAIFSIIFGRLAKVPSDGVPYPLFAFVGLVLWTFFANAVTNSGNSLVANSNLITKVYFPRLVIPGAAVAASVVDLLISSAVLIALLFYYGHGLTWHMLALPLLIGQAVLLAFAVGTWMAALNVKYRDVRYALPFVVQLLMFASPILYPASLVPERWRLLFALNPLVGIIENFRAAWLGRPFELATLGISLALTLLALTYAVVVFQKMERRFADVV